MCLLVFSIKNQIKSFQRIRLICDKIPFLNFYNIEKKKVCKEFGKIYYLDFSFKCSQLQVLRNRHWFYNKLFGLYSRSLQTLIFAVFNKKVNRLSVMFVGLKTETRCRMSYFYLSNFFAKQMRKPKHLSQYIWSVITRKSHILFSRFTLLNIQREFIVCLGFEIRHKACNITIRKLVKANEHNSCNQVVVTHYKPQENTDYALDWLIWNLLDCMWIRHVFPPKIYAYIFKMKISCSIWGPPQGHLFIKYHILSFPRMLCHRKATNIYVVIHFGLFLQLKIYTRSLIRLRYELHSILSLFILVNFYQNKKHKTKNNVFACLFICLMMIIRKKFVFKSIIKVRRTHTHTHTHT